MSDTFHISKLASTTIYVVRSNFTKTNLVDYINELENESRVNDLKIIFNGVGSSSSMGYKYGYQYGYQYGYNYGYGYGYNKDN